MIVETLEAEEVADKIDEVVEKFEETVAELTDEAVLNKAAGGVEAIRDKTAGRVEAVRGGAARGVVDWIVAAPSTYKGWLLEVCPRSAGGVEAIRDKAVESPVEAEKPTRGGRRRAPGGGGGGGRSDSQYRSRSRSKSAAKKIRRPKVL